MNEVIKKLPIKIIIGALVLGFIAIFGTSHDEFLYQQPIFKVESVHNGNRMKSSDEFHNADYQINQKLNGTIMNGKLKGKHLTINNTFSHSGAMDREYHVHNEAFISYHQHGQSTIKDYKRDVPIVFLVWLSISLLVIFLRMSGVSALLSIIVNSFLFYDSVLINYQTQGDQVLFLFGTLAIIFSAITLWLILGFSRQMLTTLCSTIAGTLVSIVVSLIVFTFTHEHGMYYESMQYVTQLPKPLFLSETLIGSLGAVMDESTDIISSLFALKSERPQISRKQIFLSGRQIGASIMGPLVNVLFFIFMGSTLPLALLFLKNGNSIGYSFSMNMSLGIVQSLISGIGIVAAVPLASLFASLFIKGGAKK
ncbi:membrane protein [Philodulcilactobacillus myokoensis]|uniref:Membrane protein n=1 Tax=Philodulcilactobacillus myokoensis TaxID=2929573 RepID=A0A9W6ESN5_9LACO|nr:membrane protein [Philodulcilactobacillus myokoensis]